jgi:hypothetical protein
MGWMGCNTYLSDDLGVILAGGLVLTCLVLVSLLPRACILRSL